MSIKVTYITVVFNRVKQLERCMESVWKQDYSNIEYIIVDGGSTDGTLDIIKKNADKISFYISEPDNGIYNAMNKGLDYATGDLICFINSDDECCEHAAITAVKAYEEYGADIICGRRILLRGDNVLHEVSYPRYPIRRSVFRYIQMYHQSTYVTKETFSKIGKFDEKYSLLSDWIWESKAIDMGITVKFIEDKLAKFSYDGASCKGIVIRDEEWIEWANSIFPSISKRNCAFLIFCMDRGRHPLFRIKTINKVAKLYYSNKIFYKVYCETILLACIEECVDIERLKDLEDRKTVKYINKCLNRIQIEEKSIYKIKSRMDFLLNQSCHNNLELTSKDLRDLDDLKQCLNRIFIILYLRGNHNKEKKFDYILRCLSYILSFFVANSIYLSRYFYVILRNVWKHIFHVKYIEI